MDYATWRDVFAAAGLLSRAFAYPDAELAGELSSGSFLESALQTGLDGNGLREYAGKDPQAILEGLRVEASRLFHSMPTARISPYGGVWHSNDRGAKPMLGAGAESRSVESFCGMCGLSHPAGTNEPLDHISTELELLQYLAGIAAGEIEEPDMDLPGGSAQAAFGEFASRHLGFWAPRFCDAVEDEAEEPFYLWASENLKLFLEALLPYCDCKSGEMG